MGAWGAAAAGLAGLLSGGIGAISGRSQAKQQRAEAQQAQADQLAQFQQTIQANNSAQSRLAAMKQGDMERANQAAAPAVEQIGSGGLARRLKFGGLDTIKTSMFGDTSVANTAKRRLLN